MGPTIQRGVLFTTKPSDKAATPKQAELFRDMIADRSWDTMDFIDGRVPTQGFVERIVCGILAHNDDGMADFPMSHLDEIISDLKKFKGWNKRTYQEAVAGITDEQLTNLVLLRENRELWKYIEDMEQRPKSLAPKLLQKRWGARIFGHQRDHILEAMEHPGKWIMVAYFPSKKRGSKWAHRRQPA